MEMNGIANVIMNLELMISNNEKASPQQLKAMKEELLLMVKYIREFEKNSSVKWHQMKKK